jgi:competence protein ComEA
MKLKFSALMFVLVALLIGGSVNAQVAEHVEPSVSEAQEAAVNINTAGADELSEQLSGVGPVKAKAIVAWREENGLFQHVDELVEVKGIGQKTLDKNSGKLTVGSYE